MSSTIIAYATIGVRVNQSQLWREVVKPGCSCCRAVEGAKFCPQCGKPATVKEIVEIDGWDLDRDTFGKYKLVSECVHWGGDGPMIRGEQAVIAGVVTEAAGYKDNRVDGVPISGDAIEALRQQMKADLEPLGFWKEESFGLWVVLYYS